MSVYAMKPTFTDRTTYLNWKTQWKLIYRTLCEDIRRRKQEVKALQRANDPTAAKAMRLLFWMGRDATKMMTLLQEARDRRDRILAMHKQIADQDATFPLTIEASVADLHYNRGANEFAFLPTWVIKAKGRQLFVRHLDCQMPWSTRELESGSTRGMIRVRHCSIAIDKDSVATITPKVAVKLVA